jgi:hypothetical protein
VGLLGGNSSKNTGAVLIFNALSAQNLQVPQLEVPQLACQDGTVCTVPPTALILVPVIVTEVALVVNVPFTKKFAF